MGQKWIPNLLSDLPSSRWVTSTRLWNSSSRDESFLGFSTGNAHDTGCCEEGEQITRVPGTVPAPRWRSMGSGFPPSQDKSGSRGLRVLLRREVIDHGSLIPPQIPESP